jgi:ankyrin repeat protein
MIRRSAAALLARMAAAMAAMPVAELFAACEAGRDEEVRAILQGADANGTLQCLLLRRQHGCTVMHRAAAFGHFRVVTELLARGAEANAITAAGVTPLHMGSECGCTDVVDVLVAFGAQQPPDDYGSTPLHRAAFAGSMDVVAMLLEGGGIEDARDANGHTPLHVAAHCGVSRG